MLQDIFKLQISEREETGRLHGQIPLGSFYDKAPAAARAKCSAQQTGRRR
jgi:hypothetical protein